MCGITGISYASNTTFDRSSLLSSLTALHHRGPDDSGVFEDQVSGIGLAHARLSILDLSPAGHQPMLSPNGKVVLVFNGEIYNFQELRDELKAIGHSFVGSSDTEVLLHFYLEHRHLGTGFFTLLKRLNGIFSFALWDSEIDSLLVARDAVGVKPLYYSAAKGRVSFSSEVKSLLFLMPEIGKIDEKSIDRYLTFLWCPGEGTPVQNVKKLAPGEGLLIRHGEICDRITWYKLPVVTGITAASNKRSAILGTEKMLRQAVHRQLVADVPVGAFLSGGLDSSSVVAFAREINPDIRCFTIEAPGGEKEGLIDDLPFARLAAKHMKVPLEVVSMKAENMVSDLEAMVEQLDEPLADIAPLNVLYISRVARENGIKVLLSGAGGDDIFTGYRRHRAILAERWWEWLPLRARMVLEKRSSELDSRNVLFRRLSKLFSGASLSKEDRLINYFRWTRRVDLMEIYTEDFKAALGDSRAEEPMKDFLATMKPFSSPLDKMLALEQRYFLTDHNLTYTDKMSMAASVEVRVPFLDMDLIEFAASIPERYKQRGAESKWVLKKAMEPYLPRDIIYRPKSGFGVPLRRWMRVELRGLLADVLSEDNLTRRGLFNPSVVQRLIKDNDSGKRDTSYTLLSLMCIEMWCKRYIDTTHSVVSGSK